MSRSTGRGADRRPAKGRPGRSARTRGPSRQERRRAVQARRNRFMLVLGALVSAVVVAAWFPASALFHQRQQLAAATTQLGQVRRQNQALTSEAKRLQTPSEVAHIAEQQYGLVQPGQHNYQVLPQGGSSAGTLSTSKAGGRSSASSSRSDRRAVAVASTAGGFFGRVLQTLEFWR